MIDLLFPPTRPFQTDDPVVRALQDALMPLARIADAYDRNQLDDEARRFSCCGENTTSADQIELYSGRGGKTLLTLADCFKARETLKGILK